MGRARTRPDGPTERTARAESYPVRNYIGAMALEMARMAVDEGDGELAALLKQAADVAGRPASH